MPTLHLFGSVLTKAGCAANNHGESAGNTCHLQKVVVALGDERSTVSAEAIRWAIRHFWQIQGLDVNRYWNETEGDHVWQDEPRQEWEKFIDDDVMGFMRTEAAKGEGIGAYARRGRFEVTRAISTLPFQGDISFNATSGAKKGRTSLYGTEMHWTRYSYGFGLTPQRLHCLNRFQDALDAIMLLSSVGGNQSRFLFDFSPESIILRHTLLPTPQILYAFHEDEETGDVTVPRLLKQIKYEDIDPSELYIGGEIAEDPDIQKLKDKFAFVFPGIRKTFTKFKEDVSKRLKDLPHNDPQPPMPKGNEEEKPKKRGRKAKSGNE